MVFIQKDYQEGLFDEIFEVQEEDFRNSDIIDLQTECLSDADCIVENGHCNDAGQCKCLEGILSVYDDQDPMKLTWCKDPIILTSTVGGYCVGRHS